MAEKSVPFHFSLQIHEPAEYLILIMRKFADSPDENRRAVAKAMTDLSAIGVVLKDAMVANDRFRVASACREKRAIHRLFQIEHPHSRPVAP
jgi:hypothetical protein